MISRFGIPEGFPLTDSVFSFSISPPFYCAAFFFSGERRAPPFSRGRCLSTTSVLFHGLAAFRSPPSLLLSPVSFLSQARWLSPASVLFHGLAGFLRPPAGVSLKIRPRRIRRERHMPLFSWGQKKRRVHALRFLSMILQKITAAAVLTAVAAIDGPTIAAGFALPYLLR